MLRYAILNISVLGIMAVAVRGNLPRPFSRIGIIVAIMFGLTAIFDNVIIGLDIVRYVPEHWSHLAIGLAPIEDFAYALLAALLIPTIWERIK